MTPRVALLIIGDGRDGLKEDTLRSFAAHCDGLQPAFAVEVDDRMHRLGFCGAIREGWERLRALPGWTHVFHLEEDWHFDRDFNLAAMIDLLDAYPGLAQVALRRGPVNRTETDAGGVVEMWPDEYLEKAMHDHVDGECVRYPWLEHGLYFTTNPCVYRRELLEMEWPEEPRCEAEFTITCVSRGLRFALWGSRREGPWITHTGRTRTGTGY